MKWLKKTAAIVLLLSLLSMLFSCGDKPEETVTATQDAPVTIDDDQALDAFITAYRAGEYDEQKAFRYEDLTAYFTLGKYKGLQYPDDAMIRDSVSDERVEDYLIQNVVINKIPDDQYQILSSGTVQKYDVVTIDYRGVIDGKDVASATANDQSLLIGSHSYIDGFESGLIGAKVGKETVLNLSFSPYYEGGDAAGKDVTFYVTVKEIRRPTLTDLTVEAVNEVYGTSFESLDAVRADLKASMEDEQQNNAFSHITTYLEKQILADSTIKELPAAEMEKYKAHFISFYQQYAGAEELTLEDYVKNSLGVPYEQFEAAAQQYAEETVSAVLLIRSIAAAEKITCSDEQLRSVILGLYENSGSHYANMHSFITDQIAIYGPDYFEDQVLQQAVLELIYENAERV